MFIVKFLVLMSWLFVGFFVLPLKWHALTHIAFTVGIFPITWAFILTAGVFFLGIFKLKAE